LNHLLAIGEIGPFPSGRCRHLVSACCAHACTPARYTWHTCCGHEHQSKQATLASRIPCSSSLGSLAISVRALGWSKYHAAGHFSQSDPTQQHIPVACTTAGGRSGGGATKGLYPAGVETFGYISIMNTPTNIRVRRLGAVSYNNLFHKSLALTRLQDMTLSQ
jgi:hypothetical protein